MSEPAGAVEQSVSDGTLTKRPMIEDRRTAQGDRRHIRRLLENSILPYGMIAPSIIVLMGIIVFPLFYSLFLSLYSWRLAEVAKPKPFIFLDNYQVILTDPVFWTATKTTMLFVVGAVSVELVLGFAIALLLANIGVGRGVCNSIILLPMITAPVVVGLIWRYMYDPQFGLIGYVFRVAGANGQIGWLGQPQTALPSVMLTDVWEMTPFVILVLHAGIMALPDPLVDAAKVDGASSWQLIRHIIIPFLMPLIILVLLIRTMDTYRVFDTIYAMTKGGPERATESLAIYTYNTGFQFFRMGHATALAIITLAMILVISVFYLRVMRSK